jgi:hypothetical protein
MLSSQSVITVDVVRKAQVPCTAPTVASGPEGEVRTLTSSFGPKRPRGARRSS